MNSLVRSIFLIIGVIGVTAFRYLPNYWYLLMWIPISVGFGIYYGDTEK